jgi:hypothetical protein
MPLGPTGRANRDVLSFRCPPELYEWVLKMARGDVKKTDAAVWALRVARDYTESLAEYEARIRQLAAAFDMTELGVVKRALERGLPLLERDLKNRK